MPLDTQVEAVRAEIKALIVAAVPAGTPVYDYVRNVNHEDTVASIMKDTGGKLHFWQFGLAPESPMTVEQLPGGCARVTTRWELHGYLALKDLASPATEKVLDGEAADLIDAVEAQRAVPGSLIRGFPAQRVQGGHVALVNTLCNYARLSMATLIHTGV